ncbi:MAG: hypothetical protein PHD21_06760 [Flavobacteriales bacterium]|nr:hypothetical protein [Flavobacteriales bacterium]
MSATTTFGLSSIKVGACGANGAMGTVLEVLGKTYKDSCKLTQADPEVTEHYSEESDDPEVTVSKSGKITLAASIMNPSLQVMQKLFGGTVVEASSTVAERWNAPDVMEAKEMSIEITPTKGFKCEIPRASVVAKVNGTYARTGIFLIDITATVLKPEGEVAKISFVGSKAE